MRIFWIICFIGLGCTSSSAKGLEMEIIPSTSQQQIIPTPSLTEQAIPEVRIDIPSGVSERTSPPPLQGWYNCVTATWKITQNILTTVKYVSLLTTWTLQFANTQIPDTATDVKKVINWISIASTTATFAATIGDNLIKKRINTLESQGYRAKCCCGDE